MTVFVVSHNLQITSDQVPSLSAQALVEALKSQSSVFSTAEALNHPHWLIRLESSLPPDAMAQELVQAWKKFRIASSHGSSHHWLALGGRKDSPGAAGSPLQEGSWGVDVVECADPEQFLIGINWEGLKSGRPSDAVFEIKV
jgi:hypothetical protein|tara:strand:+ start:87 stop:512 length:426 start_codon:yes stop_codon:yes gene_type:complete